MRCCVTSIQALTPIGSPTSGCSSASVAKLLMANGACRAAPRAPAPPRGAANEESVGALIHPHDDGLPLLPVALEAGRRHVPQRQAMRCEVDVVLGIAQEAEQRHAHAGQELA